MLLAGLLFFGYRLPFPVDSDQWRNGEAYLLGQSQVFRSGVPPTTSRCWPGCRICFSVRCSSLWSAGGLPRVGRRGSVGTAHDPLFRRLETRRPVGNLGYSIWLYDLTGDLDGLKQLRDGYRKVGIEPPPENGDEEPAQRAP